VTRDARPEAALQNAPGFASSAVALPCPYFAGRDALWEIHRPRSPLEPATLDALLAAGFRRQERLFYRPRCPTCRACVPLRVPLADFRASRSQRRAQSQSRGLERRLLAEPEWTSEHQALLARYLRRRHRAPEQAADAPPGFIVQGIPSRLLELRQGERLLAAMVIDWGEVSASAVYAFYAPEEPRAGFGTASILAVFALAAAHGLRWVYLGLWIADHPKMHYKIRFRPHERRLGGHWRRFDDPRRGEQG
jgi:arginine-tRNA-protein transferase